MFKTFLILNKYKFEIKRFSHLFFLLQDSVSTASDEPYRIVRGRKIKGYTDQDLNDAMSEIKNGMPVYRASRQFNVPQRTLRSIIERTSGTNKTPNPTIKLHEINVLKSRAYTLEERETALEEIRSGAPVAKIARLYNIPQRTLRTCIERAKVKSDKEKSEGQEVNKSSNEHQRLMLINRIKAYNEQLVENAADL